MWTWIPTIYFANEETDWLRSVKGGTQLYYLIHGTGVFEHWLLLNCILEKEGLDETEVPAFTEVKEL